MLRMRSMAPARCARAGGLAGRGSAAAVWALRQQGAKGRCPGRDGAAHTSSRPRHRRQGPISERGPIHDTLSYESSCPSARKKKKGPPAIFSPFPALQNGCHDLLLRGQGPGRQGQQDLQGARAETCGEMRLAIFGVGSSRDARAQNTTTMMAKGKAAPAASSSQWCVARPARAASSVSVRFCWRISAPQPALLAPAWPRPRAARAAQRLGARLRAAHDAMRARIGRAAPGCARAQGKCFGSSRPRRAGRHACAPRRPRGVSAPRAGATRSWRLRRSDPRCSRFALEPGSWGKMPRVVRPR